MSQRREARARRRASEFSRDLSGGLDFTGRMHAFCTDITQRLDEYRHVDMSRVAVTFSQARKMVTYGVYATTTPMRFEGGRLTQMRNGRLMTFQRLFDPRGLETMYVISFYLPRFLNIDYREKLITVFHELWHISPTFNGDLRRHPGRCYAHTGSQKSYDALMAEFVDRYLSLEPPDDLFGFLRLGFAELRRKHGSIHGVRIPHPKLIPVREPDAIRAAGA